ncbi:hypothetical protein [Clostridium ljungdahlii]|uniref:Uncharacterized protein n=1 Tax=Clostridium ljungdahlii (strain ATCC 55383 / DSM 13528 / PETC) TaxID=748727 RepID=D8GR09_CLOLD|nr:hypothetical protein [Clostridium ljungdahlii]ADK16314.1 hypothetical protein CLJU_c32670 [Clostridium ljungdahlii DSM 13528]OAA89813.1 hypothetical protein WX45_01651 [Clostridium ljungdahlii DSM 13528]
MEHILITYSAECAEEGHVDPNFTQLVYGNSRKNGDIIKEHIIPGSYIFFNANIEQKRFITAYFEVEKILIKGQHDSEINALKCDAKVDEVVVIGDRNHSKILTAPLLLDRALMGKLTTYGADDAYFNRKLAAGCSELEAIKDKTLNPRVITEQEKELLINLCMNRG